MCKATFLKKKMKWISRIWIQRKKEYELGYAQAVIVLVTIFLLFFCFLFF